MGRPLTTLTMAQGARLNKKNKKFNLFFLSRFIGLFRKGVPHGRALVIGEDGKQVKDFFEQLNILLNTCCQRCYDRRCGRGPSTEAGQRGRILNLNFSIQRWGRKQLLSKRNKMKVDLRCKTLSFSERVETSKNEPPVFRLVSEICVGLPFCYLFIYKTNLNICLLIFLFHADHCTLYHKSGPGRLKALKQIIVLKFSSAFLPNLTKIWHW